MLKNNSGRAFGMFIIILLVTALLVALLMAKQMSGSKDKNKAEEDNFMNHVNGVINEFNRDINERYEEIENQIMHPEGD